MMLDESTPASAPTSPAVAAGAPPGSGSAQVGASEVVPTEAALLRAEQKPPLYRFFRGGIYVLYMAIVVWFVVSISVAAARSVWGPAGGELRARGTANIPVSASPASADP